MIGSIYLISGIQGQGCYVGQTSRPIEVRWYYGHRRELRQQIHHNPHLQNAWNKYGEEAYDCVVLEGCPVEELGDREIYWHDRLETEGVNLYNIGTCGDATALGRTFGPLSPETRLKISEALSGLNYHRCSRGMSGKTHSAETKRKMSEAHLGNNSRLGRKHSEETKRKISQSRKSR